MEAGEDEENNTCLLDHLRPELSGFRAAANVIVPCQKCSVDNTRGYIVIEYSCLIGKTGIKENILLFEECNCLVDKIVFLSSA